MGKGWTVEAKRLLHTEWSLGWGGQEIRIIAEMKAIRQRGWEVELDCRPGSRIAEQARLADFLVHEFGFHGPLDLGTVSRLRMLIRRRGISLVHTHSSVDGYCGALAARWAGVPVVRSRHLSSWVRPGWKARWTYECAARPCDLQRSPYP